MSAAERYLNKMAALRISQQEKKLIPNFISNFNKQAIRDARQMKSAASKAELEWMKANPEKATKVYKSGTKEFGGETNQAALRLAREEAMALYLKKYTKRARAWNLAKGATQAVQENISNGVSKALNLIKTHPKTSASIATIGIPAYILNNYNVGLTATILLMSFYLLFYLSNYPISNESFFKIYKDLHDCANFIGISYIQINLLLYIIIPVIMVIINIYDKIHNKN